MTIYATTTNTLLPATHRNLLIGPSPLKSQVMANIKTAIDQLHQGRPILIVDDEVEGEGDVCIPAQIATPQIINFMCTHCRGIVCQPITVEMAIRLELPLMVANGSTAFTVSVDAIGVGSGTSAFDRAKTAQIVAQSNTTAKDLHRPGHIFPLVARPGGVLERPGHTEASSDLVRLAGFTPSAVICEVMEDDGNMAGPESLIQFATKQNLHVITVRDVIEYRSWFDKDAPSGQYKFHELTTVMASGNGNKEHQLATL